MSPRIKNNPAKIVLIPLRDQVLMPNAMLPVMVEREAALKAVQKAKRDDDIVVFTLQKDKHTSTPSTRGLEKVACLGRIVHSHERPDDRIEILIQGLERVKLENVRFARGYFLCSISMLPFDTGVEAELDTVARMVKDYFRELVEFMDVPDEALEAVLSQDSESFLLSAAAQAPIDVKEKQKLLESESLVDLGRKLAEFLLWKIKYFETKRELEQKVHMQFAKGQRQMILSQLQDEIKKEMEEEDEFSLYEKKIKSKGMPQEAQQKALSELKRLGNTPPMSPEASVIRSWLDWMVEMPWSERTQDNLDVAHAKEVLDQDHYGLEDVKERILEYLSVLQLKGSTKGQVLCFVGPPGVGKTSLARSVARALGRKFVRASLGGLRDEAEIRGHRRTYVGALPGKIIQQIRRAGTKNPVFLLDEIDKVGTDYRGDPQAALMEVLDPEINSQFMDHYLEVDFDLSQVLFITTANYLPGIPKPLLDRMDVIQLRGYTDFEKMEIAKRHLIPRLLEENGLDQNDFHISQDALLRIIREYTSEAGVRELERQIARLMRKAARRKIEKSTATRITPKNLDNYLDLPNFDQHQITHKNPPGVFHGLAWTEAGGDVLRVETNISRGKGRLITTGQLGEVLDESIKAAFSYIKAHRREFGLPPEFQEIVDIHIHIPEGAIPKDGPSAGLAVLASLVSALTNTPVEGTLAATGEITLTGQVLKVGGLVAKLLAAQRTGIKTVFLPEDNQQEVQHTDKKMKKKLVGKLELIYISQLAQFIEKVFPQKGKTRFEDTQAYIEALGL